MLNLTEIAARIQRPSLCQASDIPSLQTLCETYPYSQVFPLLYLNTLAKTNDVRLDAELQKFAYRIADRSVLYELLHATEIQQPLLSSEDSTGISEENTNTFAAEVVQNTAVFVNETSLTPTDVSVQTQAEEAENTPPETVAEIPSISLEEEIKPDLDVVATSEPTDQVTVKPSLDDALLASLSAGVTGYSLEAEEKKVQVEHESPTTVESTSNAPLDVEHEKQKLIAALMQNKPLVAIETVKEQEKIEAVVTETQIPTTSARSFTSWLKSNHTEETTHASKEIKEIKEDRTQLIDRFISTEPKISSPKEKLFENRVNKQELYNPTKKAKESIDDSQLPVSETLAKIFAAQGNYPKAISSYQQLMLIFPEKKVFFASQIEELNKKLNI